MHCSKFLQFCQELPHPRLKAQVCGNYSIKHSTPPFIESLDAMQLIVESGKFALVREEYCDWRAPEVKPSMSQHECTIFLYRTGKGPQDNIFFKETGNSRQEAFYTAALSAMGYDVCSE